MRTRSIQRTCRVLLMFGALCLTIPAWALHLPAMHWPWHRHPHASGPQPVQELSIQMQSAAGAKAIPQYWDRNTLLLDLTGVSGEGSALLAPRPGTAWPARLEFRVQSGSFANLEVNGAERVLFTVPAQGTPTLLKLDPGVYLATTAAITVRWRAADDLPH